MFNTDCFILYTLVSSCLLTILFDKTCRCIWDQRFDTTWGQLHSCVLRLSHKLRQVTLSNWVWLFLINIGRELLLSQILILLLWWVDLLLKELPECLRLLIFINIRQDSRTFLWARSTLCRLNFQWGVSQRIMCLVLLLITEFNLASTEFRRIKRISWMILLQRWCTHHHLVRLEWSAHHRSHVLLSLFISQLRVGGLLLSALREHKLHFFHLSCKFLLLVFTVDTWVRWVTRGRARRRLRCFLHDALELHCRWVLEWGA
jgi:hypothetical protein